MTTRDRFIAAIIKLGGSVTIINGGQYHELQQTTMFEDAPFTGGMGINYRRKILYAMPHFHVGEAVHEAAHMFASKWGPNNNKCEEYAFLGWEYALARQVGCMELWMHHMKDYQVETVAGFLDDWKSLERHEQAAIIADRLTVAKKRGLVDKRGNPRAIR